MNVTLMSHAVLAILCLGVIVQTMRLSRRLKAMTDGRLKDTVAALERATAEARTVLEALRRTLGGEGAAIASNLASARELSEELSILVGIADAMADRLAGDKPPPEPAAETVQEPMEDETPVHGSTTGELLARLRGKAAA